MSDTIEEISAEEYNVHIINSIANKYPLLRQSSKGPTFALTYGGTSYALVNQCGIPEDEAAIIETKYHELYAASDKWVQDQLKLASKEGYITLAFGGRLRTPILKQTFLNKSTTPAAAAAESRTAGNALGQSYGLLNNRAAIEFMKLVWASEYAHVIKPIAHIHDAQYFLIEDTVGCLEWVNNTLIACMQWQDLPSITDKTVLLGAELCAYYPTWAHERKLANQASRRALLDTCAKPI